MTRSASDQALRVKWFRICRSGRQHQTSGNNGHWRTGIGRVGAHPAPEHINDMEHKMIVHSSAPPIPPEGCGRCDLQIRNAEHVHRDASYEPGADPAASYSYLTHTSLQYNLQYRRISPQLAAANGQFRPGPRDASIYSTRYSTRLNAAGKSSDVLPHQLFPVKQYVK